MGTALTLADLNTTVNHEPRIAHQRLAEALGYGRQQELGSLIERHREALQRFAAISVTATQNADHKGRGRPGKTYWLNKKQALYLCTKSETANATEVTIQMVEVFDAYLEDKAEAEDLIPVRAHTRRRPKPGFGTIIADTDRLHPFISTGDELVVEFCTSATMDFTEPGAVFILMNPCTRKPEPHWLARENRGVFRAPDPNVLLSQAVRGDDRDLMAKHWPVLGRVIGIHKPTAGERRAELARCA